MSERDVDAANRQIRKAVHLWANHRNLGISQSWRSSGRSDGVWHLDISTDPEIQVRIMVDGVGHVEGEPGIEKTSCRN